jgi:glycosyltransferase involved in cell wall biosynthesis
VVYTRSSRTGATPITSLMRPQLIFATRRPPFPLDNGARIRANRLLHGLADAFDVVLVTPRHVAGSRDGVVSPGDVADTLPASVRIAWAPGLGALGRTGQAGAVLRLPSYEWGRYATRALSRTLRAELERARDAVLHLDDPGVALAARGLDARLRAFAPHNVEHRIVRAHAAGATSVPRRAFWSLEARKVTAEERRLWRESDICVAVSSVDAAAMRAGGARDVIIAPNGTDPVLAEPLAPRRAPGPVQLLFVGSGTYAPNERGLSWFVREALPEVRERVPVAFDVVGRPPHRPVAAPEVRYVGSVPTVAPHYARAHAVVVPLFEGSGTRLKVVEAMAHGRPVISTGLGAEGLPVRAGEHFLRAETPREFAEAVARVDRWMAGSDELDGLLARASGVARDLLWPEIGAALAAEYKERLC